MKSLQRLLTIVSFSVSFLLSDPVRAEKRPPNVIVIVAEDLGWADLGCYGSKFHRTPNLDALAAAGMRFTDAYAAAPVGSPSRAALFTGKAPARLHLTDDLPPRPDRPDQRLLRPDIRRQLPGDEMNLARILKKAGYATGHIGKWNLGDVNFGPAEAGFDFTIGGGDNDTLLRYFAPYKRSDGSGEQLLLSGLEKAPEGEYLTDRLTSEAEGFLERNKERPFFLYLAHYAPHLPLQAKADLVAKYPKERVLGRQSNGVYAAMLESFDEGVGRLVRKLDELKLSDQTLVIVTSTNGGLATLEGPDTPATNNAPLREGKGWLYEGGLRVPLLIKWPGAVHAGKVSGVPVISQDLFPTLLEACGVATEDKTDGVSLLGECKGMGMARREALYWHFPHTSSQGGRPGGAMRQGEYKLVEFYDTGRRELYHLKADLGESRNISGDKPELVEQMARQLAAWRSEVGAQSPKPNPDYKPNPQAADGSITLAAGSADVQGLQLRYEPLPHKNTLGFWVRAEDTASWEFTVTRSGTFQVEILQGCGNGQGGSEVDFVVAGQTLHMVVVDTGGFQQFVARNIGSVTIDKPGRYTLLVRPTKKAKAAVMDLRQVVLKLKES